jgi:hypothetical protein
VSYLTNYGYSYRNQPSDGAHPNYDKKPWFNNAMVDWTIREPGKKPRKARLPAFIRTFIDLSALSAGINIRIPESGKNVFGGKLYSLVNGFSAVDAGTDCPNAIVGLNKVARPGPGQTPTLYLVQATSIATPTRGIRDVGNPGTDHCLFLFCRRVEWPGAWDSMTEEVLS